LTVSYIHGAITKLVSWGLVTLPLVKYLPKSISSGKRELILHNAEAALWWHLVRRSLKAIRRLRKQRGGLEKAYLKKRSVKLSNFILYLTT
jgi:hypothetical protein